MEHKTVSQSDVFNLITERIIEKLSQNVVPWQQPWADSGLPQNLVTRKPYSGINVWLLAMLNYPLNYFLTFKQVQDLGGTVIKGEKSCPVVYWKWSEKTDEATGEVKKVSMIRYYTVFNISQVKDIPKEKIPDLASNPNSPIEECELIVELMPNRPQILSIKNEAYYNPQKDFINMPPMKKFKNSECYYMTLFHELIHATGHQSRLNRKEVTEKSTFASESHSQEELVAELGACYLKSFTGIANVEFQNSVAYIQGWLKRLRDDKKFIIYAASKAHRAVDFILDRVETQM